MNPFEVGKHLYFQGMLDKQWGKQRHVSIILTQWWAWHLSCQVVRKERSFSNLQIRWGATSRGGWKISNHQPWMLTSTMDANISQQRQKENHRLKIALTWGYVNSTFWFHHGDIDVNTISPQNALMLIQGRRVLGTFPRIISSCSSGDSFAALRPCVAGACRLCGFLATSAQANELVTQEAKVEEWLGYFSSWLLFGGCNLVAPMVVSFFFNFHPYLGKWSNFG